MKKLRLISFLLAFVMVVAMMVPALALLVAADGNTLPSGTEIGAWNIGFSGVNAITAAASATTGTVANPYAEAAWAGQAYQEAKAKLETAENASTNFKKTWTLTPKGELALDNLYGFMLDISTTRADSNGGVTFVIDVDGVAYYNLARVPNGDLTTDPEATSSGAVNYIQIGGAWTAVSNINYAFSGVTRPHYVQDPANNGNINFERTIRFPAQYSGKWFAPLESFTAAYGEKDISNYHKKADIAIDGKKLTTETLANAESVTIYVTAVYSDNLTINSASIVYDTDYVMPVEAPKTLPALNAAEWAAHAGYTFGTYQADYPDGVFIRPSIAGAEYTVSDNLLDATIPSNTTPMPDDTDDAYTQAEVTAVPADENLVGLMLRVKAPDAGGKNIGLTFAFKANGNFYSGRIGNGAANGGRAVYAYDANSTEGWEWYRDPTSHTTARAIANFDGFYFIPVEHFAGLKNQEAAYAHRQDVVASGYNAYDDLTTAGISFVEFGHSWFANENAAELLEVNYVYSDAIKTSNDFLPAGDLLTWSMTYTTLMTSAEVYFMTPNATGDAFWAGSTQDLVAVEGAKLDAPVASTGDKFLSSYEYDLTGLETDNLLGVNIAIDTTTATNSQNGTVVAIDVDGKVYYNVSFTERVNSYILRENTGDWIVVSGFAGAEAGKPETVLERAVRLPNKFVGEMFVPLESFRAAYGTDAYNGTKVTDPAAEETLTADILAAATSVKLIANTTWGDTTVFGAANLVYRGPYVELAPEGDKPVALPEVEDIAYVTDFNNNFWTDAVVDNAVTMFDGMWGAEFTATADATDLNWADFAGILLTVNTETAADVFVNLGFSSEAFTTKQGDGAKPIYLWQGETWLAQGAGDRFHIPAGYNGYVLIPVTAFTGGRMSYNAGFGIDDLGGLYATLFSNFVRDLANETYLYSDITIDGITPTAVEFLTVEGLGDLYDSGDEATKPTEFPVPDETYYIAHGGIFNSKNANMSFIENYAYAWTPLTGLGLTTDPQVSKAISQDRNLPSKFAGVGMLTDTLYSSENGLAISGTSFAEGQKTTFEPTATPTINAATAAGLLIKANHRGTFGQGLGWDIGVTIGEKTYRFFDNATAASYNGENGVVYYYDSLNDYETASWTAVYGDSKLRLPCSFDGYIFVPFTNLRECGTKATIDMAELAEKGITSVDFVAWWNAAAEAVIVESIEIASASASIGAASVTVGNDLALNVSAFVSGTPTSVKMNFIIGETTKTVDGTLKDGEYIFTLTHLGAQQMADLIDLELVVDDKVVSTIEDYSIVDYALGMIANTTEKKIQTLAVDLLYYGAAMQTYLNYNTDNLATSALSATEMDYRSTNKLSTVKDKVVLSDAISTNAQFKGVTVAYDGGFQLVVTGVVLDTTGVVATVKVGSNTTTIAADKWGVKNNQYVIVLNNLSFADVKTEITVSFTKGETTDGASYTLTLAALFAEIAGKSSTAPAADQELAKCVYALANAIAAYEKL